MSGAEVIAVEHRRQRLWTALVLGMTSVSVVVLTATRALEADRNGLHLAWVEIALLEGVSHLIVAAIATVGGVALFRRLGRAPASETVRYLAAGFPIFLICHVALTYGLRALLFPWVLGRDYELHPFRSDVWLYEAPKDLFAYILIAAAWLLLRRMQPEPITATLAPGRISLKADGVVHLVPIEDFVMASAAGNYVEVQTRRRKLFVRMSLGALEAELANHGGRAVRTHRSYLVNCDHVTAIRPTGEGDVVVELSTGQQAPGSRRYRARLTAAAQAPSPSRTASI